MFYSFVSTFPIVVISKPVPGFSFLPITIKYAHILTNQDRVWYIVNC